VELSDAALATSGDYRNFYEVEGRRLSHTIDPRTGRPVTHALAAVSVIDESCARADALATALEVLGPDEGYALASERGWAALFITRAPDGAVTERATPAFETRVEISGDR
jgi:thiamine biosynthesis lipoprotein